MSLKCFLAVMTNEPLIDHDFDFIRTLIFMTLKISNTFEFYCFWIWSSKKKKASHTTNHKDKLKIKCCMGILRPIICKFSFSMCVQSGPFSILDVTKKNVLHTFGYYSNCNRQNSNLYWSPWYIMKPFTQSNHHPDQCNTLRKVN